MAVPLESAAPTPVVVVDSRACFEPLAVAETVLILLNGGWRCAAFVRAVWRCASVRVAADGAATRLWRALLGHPGAVCGCCGRARGDGVCDDVAGGGGGSASLSAALAADAGAAGVLAAHVPDAVCGDWDSIDGETEAYYASRGTLMVASPEDQDSTDLEKCLRHVARLQAARGGGASLRVCVYGAFGGRFDHEAQNLSCLYAWCVVVVVVGGGGCSCTGTRCCRCTRPPTPFTRSQERPIRVTCAPV